MGNSRFRVVHRGARTKWSARSAIGVLSALTAIAGLQLMPAQAATTLNPNPAATNGVIRDANMAVTLDNVSMGVHYNRNTTGTSGVNFAVVNPTLPSLTPCRGDNPAGLRNFTPRATVELSGPGGPVATEETPARNYNLLALSTATDPQPTAPGDDIYRGGDSRGAKSSFTANFDLTGQPAGTYTVTTTTYNRIREVTKSIGGTLVTNCVVGTPSGPQTWDAGPVVETKTFEYRPWQYIFTDVFGNGSVSMNVKPAETQQRIGATKAGIFKGHQLAFSLPSESTFMLPADPTVCADNPLGCLPPTAVPCDVDAGCVPSVIITSYNKGNVYDSPAQTLIGVFDLTSGAYIAYTKIGDRSRLQASLGTDLDAQYKDVLAQLSAGAASAGIDLASLLATTVRVSDGNQEIKLSLLNGLQIDPATVPAGLQILSDTTVQAGLILNIYSAIAGTCAGSSGANANVGDSDPTTPAPDRYTPLSPYGYTVEKSDLLPEVPRVSPAAELGIGGPIYHISGVFKSPGDLVNISAPLVGVDTLPNEPNGYPVWIEALGLAGSPLNIAPATTTSARTMDFLGTAMWSASETDLSILGCLTIDFMLGLGAAIFNNPLPVGFGDVPIWTPVPEVAALTTAVNAAVADATAQITTNPTIAALLAQVTGSLPPVPVPLP